MKKLIALMFASISLVAVLGVGCSSAPVTESKDAAGEAAAMPAEKSPVNLGAASSGRAI